MRIIKGRIAAWALCGGLLDLSRYVTYYEQDGLLEARDYYHRLDPAVRTAPPEALSAARDACPFHVNYPEIVRRAERYFA